MAAWTHVSRTSVRKGRGNLRTFRAISSPRRAAGRLRSKSPACEGAEEDRERSPCHRDGLLRASIERKVRPHCITPCFASASSSVNSLMLIFRRRYRCMTWRPTRPSAGCSKASGTVPMMRNPSACHSRTATALDSTTALNCIAAYLCSRAQESAYSPSARHSSALHLPGDHEARGCDVRARAGAVGTHVRRPENPRAVAGHDRAAGRGYYPHAPCLLGGPSRVIGEGLARGDDLPEDGPDVLPVGIGVSSNLQCSLLTKASGNRQPSARGRPFSVDGCVPYAHTDVAPGSSTAACPERPHLDRCPRAASPAAPVALKHGRIDAPV